MGSASLPGDSPVSARLLCHLRGLAVPAEQVRCSVQSSSSSWAFQVSTAPTEQTRLRKKQHLIQCLFLALPQHCLELEATEPFPYLSDVPILLAAAQETGPAKPELQVIKQVPFNPSPLQRLGVINASSNQSLVDVRVTTSTAEP